VEPGTATAVAAISAGLWLISLFSPVATLDKGRPGRGYWLLLVGWLGPLVFQFGWFANPLLWTAWWLLFMAGEPGSSGGMVGVGLVLTGLNAAIWDEIPTGNGSQKVTALHFGFYLWMATVLGTAFFMIVLAWATPPVAASIVG
jgi:hypothetical protein